MASKNIKNKRLLCVPKNPNAGVTPGVARSHPVRGRGTRRSPRWRWRQGPSGRCPGGPAKVPSYNIYNIYGEAAIYMGGAAKRR